MLFPNFTLITINAFKLGPSVTGIGLLGHGAERLASQPPGKLTVPWQPLIDNPSVLGLLSWHAQVSDFTGRDEQLRDLQRWADSEPPVSIKFVTGEGGTGKSRMAAVFALDLEQRGWAAGFVDLRKAQSFRFHKVGTLLVIDYPEENRQGVAELLNDLAVLGDTTRLRVLFLSRQSINNWSNLIVDAHAVALLDTVPLELHGVDTLSGYEMFCTAQRRAALKLGTAPVRYGEKQLTTWIAQAHERDRPLFILAAAVYSALNPADEVVRYTHREIVEALVDRELSRLRSQARDRQAPDECAFARLLAMAAFAGELPFAQIEALADRHELGLGLPSKSNIHRDLHAVGLLSGDAVPAPKPDIMAAALVVRVLGERSDLAPEWLWAVLEGDLDGNLQRLARLSYDAEQVLGMLEQRISVWLAGTVDGRPERCTKLEPFVTQANLPQGWLPAAVAVWRTLLQAAPDDKERARLLNNLSTHLSATGDPAGALAAIGEASEIYRRLAAANPAAFEPNLAASLNNLSNHLSETGDRAGALEAIGEASEIYRRLATANPAAFEPDLAGSLNNLSTCLSETGDRAGALAAIKKAVEVRHRLAAVNPAAFEPDLAASLNNLSLGLSETGDRAEALAAITEAVEIRRRLAAANPAAFEPNLASSLKNLSACLSATGDRAGALKTITEAVEIARRLAAANPAAFEPELASSLNNLSADLRDTGDPAGALEAIKEAVEIRRRLATANPAAFEPDLARSLYVLGTVFRAIGKQSDAGDAFRESIRLITPYARQFPQSPFADLRDALQDELRQAES